MLAANIGPNDIVARMIAIRMEARKRCIVGKRDTNSGRTVFLIPTSESLPHLRAVNDSELRERTPIVVFVIWVTVLLLKEAVAEKRDRLSHVRDPNSLEDCYACNSCSDCSPKSLLAQFG